jgi:hypothetical protein
VVEVGVDGVVVAVGVGEPEHVDGAGSVRHRPSPIHQ